VSARGITAQQVRHYEIFGYVVLRDWFEDIIQQITAEFESLMACYGPAQVHDGSQRTLRWQMLDSSPFLTSLLDDERVDSAFASTVGEDWQYFGSVGNLYAGNTGWHIDDFSPHRRAKIALYLDPTGPGHGGLSVVPLSHRITRANNELHMVVGTSRHSLGLDGPEIPAITLDTRPGDVVLFDHNILHAAWGGSGRRRMLSINAHEKYGQREQESLLVNVDYLARFMSEHPYGEYMIHNVPSSRKIHLEQLSAQQERLAEKVAARRNAGLERTKDLLPDLTDNADMALALAEFMRDTEYILVSADETNSGST
jgi:hypothetical protein